LTSSALKELGPKRKERGVQHLATEGLLPSLPITYTDLRGTDLSGAQYCSNNLSGVNLSNADLSSANLEGDNLRNADLSGANLLSAKVTEDQLEQAKSLADATMPHRGQHP
jgi:hypothetical protein